MTIDSKANFHSPYELVEYATQLRNFALGLGGVNLNITESPRFVHMDIEVGSGRFRCRRDDGKYIDLNDLKIEGQEYDRNAACLYTPSWAKYAVIHNVSIGHLFFSFWDIHDNFFDNMKTSCRGQPGNKFHLKRFCKSMEDAAKYINSSMR